MNALDTHAFLQAAIADQEARRRHELDCRCCRCAASRAIEAANRGEQPSALLFDVEDPHHAETYRAALRDVTEEMRRRRRAAAALLVIERITGRTA